MKYTIGTALFLLIGIGLILLHEWRKGNIYFDTVHWEVRQTENNHDNHDNNYDISWRDKQDEM